jgi:hypothetical protein
LTPNKRREGVVGSVGRCLVGVVGWIWGWLARFEGDSGILSPKKDRLCPEDDANSIRACFARLEGDSGRLKSNMVQIWEGGVGDSSEGAVRMRFPRNKELYML